VAPCFEAVWSVVVIDKITFARWAVVGGIIAAVGVAGAATRLKKPTTGDACLCTPDTQAPNDLTAALEPAAASSFASSRGFAAPAGSTSTPGSLTAALGMGSVAERSGSAAYGGGGGGSNGAGFGAGGRFIGARSGSGSSHAPGLGGLWRLMSLSRRAPAAHSASSTHTAAARPAPQPKPQHPRNSTGGNSGSSTGPSTTLPPGVSVVSDLFAEQTATIPELLGGGNAPVISTPGGRTGSPSGLGAGSGSLAATPEPGPLFLVGAGLIAIASLLRRRLAA